MHGDAAVSDETPLERSADSEPLWSMIPVNAHRRDVAQGVINAALAGDWLVEAIHRDVCEDDPEECRSWGRGACVRGAAAVREAGIRRA